MFGEDYETPLIIEKSGGGYLYATTDLAAIRFREKDLGANRIIYTHDSRQAQHFAQVFDTARRAAWAEGVQLDYAPFGTMLGDDGKPVQDAQRRHGEAARPARRGRGARLRAGEREESLACPSHSAVTSPTPWASVP